MVYVKEKNSGEMLSVNYQPFYVLFWRNQQSNDDLIN